MDGEFEALLLAKLAGICELSQGQLEQLRAHYELLVRWNRVLNLTSLRTLEEVVERHYCESIFAAKYLPEAGVSIADLGSGAGFPGIPIAITKPACSVILIESHQRKTAFLKEATRGLANVRVIGKRAEDISESFDWVVSRAVRFEDISDTLRRIARNVELLAGGLQHGGTPGFEWHACTRLPWGEQRYLWISHVSRETGSGDVPRETNGADSNS